MKLFKSSQIQEIDKYTIENEPIASFDLMERAAKAVFEEIVKVFSKEFNFCVIAGPGNNGGDGLVIARLLLIAGYSVKVFYLRFTKSISEDCNLNLNRLKESFPNSVAEINLVKDLKIDDNTVLIDAIFGSGLTRRIDGDFAIVIDKINNSGNIVLSVDIPSGLFGEDNSKNDGAIVKSDFTYALEFPSISMMFAENFKYFGDVKIVPIGLSREAIDNTVSDFYLIQNDYVVKNWKLRNRFDHKGIFGHLLILAGSFGKAGAATLAAKAAIKSGAGLVTAHLPGKLIDIMQISVPEVMVSIDACDEYISTIENYDNYSAIGLGPGLGTNAETARMLSKLIEKCELPIIIDADGLNLIAKNKRLLKKLKSGTILTPHPKEFERLFGKFENTWQKIEFMRKFSSENSVIIVLKGGITTISLPDGRVFFNNVGNPGMATAGSGDVLTGIIASLLAQNYSSENAAIIGVYLHARAGDVAKNKNGEMSLTASDIINCLSDNF